MELNKKIIILISAAVILINLNGYACTVFTVNLNGKVMAGRNLDWKFDDGDVWVQPPEKNKYGIIIFEQYGNNLPFEGMNSEGLFAGQSAVPKIELPVSFDKPLVRSLKIIKIILEECASVDEALKIFSKYNIIFGTLLGYPQVHFMVADKTGNSAIVEYFDTGIRIIRKPEDAKYQLMTNFYITNPDYKMMKEKSKEGGYDRFLIAKAGLEQMTDANEDSLRAILEACYNEIYPTIWSNVYDLKKLEINTYFRRDFNKCKIINLPEELKKGSKHYKLSDLFK